MTINKHRCSLRLFGDITIFNMSCPYGPASHSQKRPERLCVCAGRKRWKNWARGRNNLLNSHTIIKKAEWFSLRHLRRSWSQIQQVSCSSAEGLVIRGLAEVSGGGGNDWWPWGECQNYKSNWAWPTAPIKFIYIFTLHPLLKLLCLDDSKRREAMIRLVLVWVGGWIHFILYRLAYPYPLLCSGLKGSFIFCVLWWRLYNYSSLSVVKLPRTRSVRHFKAVHALCEI